MSKSRFLNLQFKKPTPSPPQQLIPFKNFYQNWHTTLSTTLLPQLQSALSSFSASPSTLSTHVDAMHHHIQSYYIALDSAASSDVASTLHPTWRNSLELPFLWLGDLHPYLLTNLLRSFLEDDDNDDDQESEDCESDGETERSLSVLDKPWHVAVAWRSPSKALTSRVDQIECGIRLMVPALGRRARDAVGKMVEGVGVDWKVKGKIKEAVETEMEEMVGVVLDANRLRRSLLADVLSVTSVYQAALFLEAVGRFLVGFRDEKLVKEFEKSGMIVN